MKASAPVAIVMALMIVALVGGILVSVVADSIAGGKVIRREFTVSTTAEDIYVNSSLNSTQMLLKFDVSDFISEAETVTQARLCLSQIDTNSLASATITLVTDQTWGEGLTAAAYDSLTDSTSQNATFSAGCLETLNLSQSNLGRVNYSVKIHNNTLAFVGNADGVMDNVTLYFGNGSKATGNAVFHSREGSTAPTLSIKYSYGYGMLDSLYDLIPVVFIIGILIGIFAIAGIKIKGKL